MASTVSVHPASGTSRLRAWLWGGLLVVFAGPLAVGSAVAAEPTVATSPAGAASVPQARSVDAWLARMRDASAGRAYQGTFVVSSASGALSRALITHACDGEQQWVRVETLTGASRTTYRHDDEVVTFWPGARVVRSEKRETLAAFPVFMQAHGGAIADFYRAQLTSSGRVAGLDADVIEFVPRDGFRYGYRAWSEKSTGLLLKLQTLDAAGRVLEQSAFSELQLNAPVSTDSLKTAMGRTDGYRVEPAAVTPTTADAEGWLIKTAVPGYQPLHCYRWAGSSASTVHWVFSDGLASVSLFIDVYDPRHHVAEAVMLTGATRTLTRRLGKPGGGRWWLTVVGEAPTRTLQAFADGLVRNR